MAKAVAEPKTPTVGGKMVTYTPLDDGDRPFVLWNTLRFEANVPKKVSDAEMLGSAVTNPWFKVEGHPQCKRVKPVGEVPAPGSGSEVGDVSDEQLDKMVEAE